jgi:polysaccharide export outer membrane protein
MANMKNTILASLLAVITITALGAMTGCQVVDLTDPMLEIPVPPPLKAGSELSMVSLPAYRIEPPDLVQIEMLKLVPLPPYRAKVHDVLQIQVVGTLLDQPIDNYYMIEGEGTVNLGAAYGTVRVAGMTIKESRDAIDEQLRKVLRNPEVSVQLARASGTQPVTGQYLVAPDGTVNLRQYGTVRIAGMTMTEARVALQRHLSQFFDSPELSVDVLAYNSKVYYIVTEGAGLGDNIVRVPVTGNETVLDAISQVGGISQLSSTNIWIARPAPAEFGCEQILPVDWNAITRGASTATNYQVMPGDRVYIAQNETIALTNFIAQITAPIERVLGLASLGLSVSRTSQTMGRQYNLNRRN